MGRAIYEHVYLAHYKGQNLNDPEIAKRFLAEAQDQTNLVLWHEGQHIKHCREGWNGPEAEQDAIDQETNRNLNLKPVFYLKLKPGANLNQAMKYIEGLTLKNNERIPLQNPIVNQNTIKLNLQYAFIKSGLDIDLMSLLDIPSLSNAQKFSKTFWGSQVGLNEESARLMIKTFRG